MCILCLYVFPEGLDIAVCLWPRLAQNNPDPQAQEKYAATAGVGVGQQGATHPPTEKETPCLQLDCCKFAVDVWLCTRLSLSMRSNAKVGHIVYDNQALQEIWGVWHLQTGSLGD